MRNLALHKPIDRNLVERCYSSHRLFKVALVLAVSIAGGSLFSETITKALAYPHLKAKERELLNYIAAKTGEDVEHISPTYEFWTPQEINKAYYGDSYENQRDVIALEQDGNIILAQGYDVNAEPEVLLHELYHVVVSENKLEHRCLAEEERAAYSLQIEYVEEMGSGRKPSPFFMMFLNCNLEGN